MKIQARLFSVIILAGLLLPLSVYCFEETKMQPTFPFKLLGTILESDSAKSMAVIKDLHLQRQRVCKVGDKIADYQIARIMRARAALLKNGKVYFLDFPLGSEAEPVITVSAEERIVNLATLREKISDLNAVMNHALVIPHIESGKIRGFKIAQVKNNALMESTGLEEGDIITKVNGQSLDSINKSLKIYHSLRNQTKINLEIQRGGGIKNLVYYIN